MTPDPEQVPIDAPDDDAATPPESPAQAEGVDALRAKAAERDEYLDRLKRTMAEFQNYKNRVGREKTDLKKFVTGEVIRAILPALDNLERAVAAAPEGADDAHLEGVRLTIADLHKALESLGVRPIETENARFDPNWMEAVRKVETDEADENTVLDVYQKGYRIDDFVIRPARVSVAGAKPPPADTDE
jgi:molecular chaperone GrpE